MSKEEIMARGATDLFMMIALISLQLGFVNLFPIPALDGGHLMIYTLEAIIRKDFSAKVKTILLNVGFFLLISLMVL
jgi:regulator of sigma E protease